MNIIAFGAYRLIQVFGLVTQELRDEIVAFWQRHGALPDPNEGAARSRQVFYVARNTAHEIVAVCTIYPAPFGAPPQPYWHYRMFIRPEDRHSGLAVMMTRCTRKALQGAWRVGDPVGLVIVMENPMLGNPVVQAHLLQAGWIAEGRDARGCDVWVRRFDHDAIWPSDASSRESVHSYGPGDS